MYTLGLKRRFLPGYRKFTVSAHEVSGQDGSYRVLLTVTDGSYIYSVCKGFKLFPDFKQYLSDKDAENRTIEAAKAEAVNQFQAQLSAQMAAQRPASPIQVNPVDTRLAALRAQQG